MLTSTIERVRRVWGFEGLKWNNPVLYKEKSKYLEDNIYFYKIKVLKD